MRRGAEEGKCHWNLAGILLTAQLVLKKIPNDCYKLLNQLMGPGKEKFMKSIKHKRLNTSCDILNEKAQTSLSESDYGIIVLQSLSSSQ